MTRGGLTRRILQTFTRSLTLRLDLLLRKRLEPLNKHLIYLSISELRRRTLDRIVDDSPINLTLSELRVFSQNGEDGVIAELVRCLPIKKRFFVEFGVQDGTECNTRFLSEFAAWDGLYLESDADDYKKLSDRWTGSTKVSVGNETVSPQNVAGIFEHYGVPDNFGLLSIDVDGQDYWIWQALPKRFQPAIVVIECNSSFPPGVPAVEECGLEWTPVHSDTFGASIEALARLGADRGYELVHVECAGINAFFIRHDLLGDCRFDGIRSRYPNYDLRGRRHPPLPVRPTVTPNLSRSG